MPLSSVLDVLGKASKNVAILMNKKIQTAPVFIKQIVRSEDNGQGANDLNPVNNSDPNLYKNIDLADLIMKATHENTIMCEIKNKEFFISYPEISKLLLVSKNIEALTKMTIILFS